MLQRRTALPVLRSECRFARALLALACAVSATLATSCSALDGTERGTLVIVGGGLRADNSEVFRAFTDAAGERVLVLPTASGIPERSGPGTAQDIAAYAAPGQDVVVHEILATTPERAQDSAWQRPIGNADALWFTGGVQSRITRVFRPGQRDSAAYRQMVALLARDGCIAGTSAGAAMMSDPMIVGGSSRAALLEGVSDDGFEMGQGLGFFGYGLVDQHFLRRGRIGRLVAALEASGVDRGWGVADNCALVVDRETATAEVLGDRAVLQVDARAAEREGLSRRGLRISLLSSGDRIDLAGLVATADPAKRTVPTIDRFLERRYLPLDPFGRDTLVRLLERLSTDPSTPQRAEKGGIALVVRGDASTRFLARDVQLADLTVLDAILDIEIDPDVVADPLLAPRR